MFNISMKFSKWQNKRSSCNILLLIIFIFFFQLNEWNNRSKISTSSQDVTRHLAIGRSVYILEPPSCTSYFHGMYIQMFINLYTCRQEDGNTCICENHQPFSWLINCAIFCMFQIVCYFCSLHLFKCSR